MATLNSHGMEPQEEAIMALWDDGKSLRQIAGMLGVSESRAELIVTRYTPSPADRWEWSARAASDALLRAIARVHPEQVAA